MANTVSKTQGKDLKKKKFKITPFVPYLGLVLIIVIFSIMSDGTMLTADNLLLVFRQAVVLLVASLAGVFVMSTGNLDFSIGANLGFCCCICCYAAQINPILGPILGILCGLGIGILNGSLQVLFGFPSFISSLCFMFALMALTQTLIPGSSISMPGSMMAWNNDVMKIVIVVIFAVIMIVLFNYTKIGKQLKAIGVSQEAARQSGMSPAKMRILVFAITGIAAGLAGFLAMLRTGGASISTGVTATTDVIIAVVFGGMSVMGGANSKISAAIIGTLMIVMLNNGMVISGLGGNYQQLVKGILFVAVVAVSTPRSKNMIVK